MRVMIRARASGVAPAPTRIAAALNLPGWTAVIDEPVCPAAGPWPTAWAAAVGNATQRSAAVDAATSRLRRLRVSGLRLPGGENDGWRLWRRADMGTPLGCGH